MEFAEMGVYLLSTCAFATLLQHPASPIRQHLPNSILRRACFGVAVGVTIAAIVLSPWGKQSGGDLNPAITLAFYRLGTVHRWDALFYALAQFAGAATGVAIATFFFRGAPAQCAKLHHANNMRCIFCRDTQNTRSGRPNFQMKEI
jgi:aquaporin Z